MTSRMAMEDIHALEKQGVHIEPEQIIRLNELGLKVERPDAREGLYSLPRCAFVGEVVFHEPSIGSELWYESASAHLPDDYETVFSLRVLQTTMRWDELPDPLDADMIAAKIAKTTEALKGATYRQVLAALNWTLFGNRDEIEPAEKTDGEDEEADPDKSFALGLVHHGQALNLGTLHDLQGMTSSALLATVQHALDVKLSGMADMRKRDGNGDAFGKYMRYLDGIKNRDVE